MTFDDAVAEIEVYRPSQNLTVSLDAAHSCSANFRPVRSVLHEQWNRRAVGVLNGRREAGGRD